MSTYDTQASEIPAGGVLIGDMPYAVNLLEEERLKSDLAKAQELSDFPLVIS